MHRTAAREQRQKILLVELPKTSTTKLHSLRPLMTGLNQAEVPDFPAQPTATHLTMFLTPDLDSKLVLASCRV